MRSYFILLLSLGLLGTSLHAQRANRGRVQADAEVSKRDQSVLSEATFSGIKLRNIGPAFTSGRIADIAVHPDNDNVWYVAVGSGGVWKTMNAGISWNPIFDNYASYSTGAITIDPNNPHIVWLGTGENVGGRHVGYGDGVYKSTDDGKSWQKMGLEASEHISKIIVHPENSDVVWVAAQGPLWSKGGERGLYMSIDGGETWTRTLGNDEWTGVTDIVLDPRDPNVLYAATWDRHRNVAAYMGGGPGSGIHKSIDGGQTWTKLKKGLPGSNMGKIGLAISPQDPDVVYAAIELDRATGGVWRSTDRGASWQKRSDAVAGATGPHYYQELYASPHQFDKIFLVDNRIQVSEDGGKSFSRLPTRGAHSDNHAVIFKADDPDYLLLGTDGGLYETLDGYQNWRFIDNMPITQYYKVAVDDREPFYHVFGGTQDNGSHGGPSRTVYTHGIRNADWYKTLGADGHQSATEPGNPDITYAETQQGGLHRIDQKTGEQVFIQPQAGPEDPIERFNWDAPIVVSSNEPSRIYFASQRVWKSENRGDSWTPISGDLTRDQNRLELPIMDKTWGYDAAWDFNAMSVYNTITSIAVAMQDEDIIYAGTDDGIVQVTTDGGQNWRKIEVGTLPGVPATAFVNDIKVDLYDPNTVYVALDNHKYGDFAPYLVKSTDQGLSWTSLSEDLPERTLVWRVVQDHVDPNLLFAATEFGIYFTLDGGEEWIKFTGGVPTISFRDLAIQRRENDLVGASFGRSFFILDDYSFLREVSEEKLAEEGTLFPTRDALWYVPRNITGSEGTAKYAADNPDYGAVFTYHLAESLTTRKSERMKTEREQAKEGGDVTFSSWEELEAERRQAAPKIWLTIKDSDGNVVQRITGPARKGMHRVAWNLRQMSKNPISTEQRGGFNWRAASGFWALPGTYTASLSKEVDGVITPLDGPVEFRVKRLMDGALEGAPLEEIASFQEDLEELWARSSATGTVLEHSMARAQAMQQAVARTDEEAHELNQRVYELKQALYELEEELEGNKSRKSIGERTAPTVTSRLYVAYRGASTTYGPTEVHQENLRIARTELSSIESELERISEEVIPQLETDLRVAGSPWIEGPALPGPGKQ
jgi:photosystem II stability/assembly factor-like uncharacterized protein